MSSIYYYIELIFNIYYMSDILLSRRVDNIKATCAPEVRFKNDHIDNSIENI